MVHFSNLSFSKFLISVCTEKTLGTYPKRNGHINMKLPMFILSNIFWLMWILSMFKKGRGKRGAVK
jgi:hypothetical protein